MANLLAIDPGLHKTGLAFFNNRKLDHTLLLKPPKSADTDWLENLDWVMCRLKELLLSKDTQLDVVVIEQPQQFVTSRKGSAASNSGAVIKLTALVHSMRQAVLIGGLECHLVPVIKWKGNVPKHITAMRLKRAGYDLEGLSLDEVDAVGLGCWYLKNG